MHEVVDAGEEQPLAAAQAADERVVERAAVQLVAVDHAGASARSGAGSGRSSRTSSSRPAAGGPGTPGTTVGCVGGPAIRGRERRREDEPGPGGGDVADRLGDVPVALAAGQRERRRPAGASTTPRRAVAVAASCSIVPQRRAFARPPPDLAADAEELALVDAAPRGDDVGRGRLELVDPGGNRHRWPFAIFSASGRPRSRHIATIPTAGPSASIQNAIRHVEPSPGSSSADDEDRHRR